LQNKSATLRDMVQMRIVTMEKPIFFKQELNRLAEEDPRPEVRLQALCTAEGIGGLQATSLSRAVQREWNPDAQVRREALRLLESREQSNRGELFLECEADETDPLVRLQLACSLGESNSPETHEALARLMVKDHSDPLIMAAALSSLNRANVGGVLNAMLALPTNETSADSIGKVLALAAAFEQRETVARALTKVVEPVDGAYVDWQIVAMDSLMNELNMPFADWAKTLPDGGQDTAPRMLKLIAWSQEQAFDEQTKAALRASCVKLLGRHATARDQLVPQLVALLSPQTPADVQLAAVQSLGRLAKPGTPELMLAQWESAEPSLRRAALDLLIGSPSPEWTAALLTAIEQGQVAAADIDAARRDRLVNSQHANLRERAAKVLAVNVNADRQKVVETYGGALRLDGEHARGKEVFAKRCSACHKVDGVGNEVGPDLGGLTDKSRGNLLLSVLDPNRSVEPKFVSYTAVTTDGRVLSGLLADESGGSLALLDADGKRHVMLRKDIEELKASGKSLMPEGLEQDISPEAMADLLAYLQAALQAKP
jgi:putative heme-binding domain-containing protein